MHKSFLKNLDLESNNVDQVYNENLKKWKSENTNLSDKDFVIQEIEYLSKIDPKTQSESDLAKRKIYSAHLSKIESNFPWDLEKLYNRYVKDKTFSMTGLILIKSMNYEHFIEELEVYKNQYYFFFERLSINDKIQLRGDFIDQLIVLRDKDIATKFKIYLDRIIHEIKKHYEEDSFTQEDSSKNHFPMFFKNSKVYECFLTYTSNHIIDYHLDYSYLIQRLLSHKLIHNHSHNDYMQFLLNEMNLITEKQYENFLDKKNKKLYTLNKSYSSQRENNFNNIFYDLYKK